MSTDGPFAQLGEFGDFLGLVEGQVATVFPIEALMPDGTLGFYVGVTFPAAHRGTKEPVPVRLVMHPESAAEIALALGSTARDCAFRWRDQTTPTEGPIT